MQIALDSSDDKLIVAFPEIAVLKKYANCASGCQSKGRLF